MFFCVATIVAGADTALLYLFKGGGVLHQRLMPYQVCACVRVCSRLSLLRGDERYGRAVWGERHALK